MARIVESWNGNTNVLITEKLNNYVGVMRWVGLDIPETVMTVREASKLRKDVRAKGYDAIVLVTFENRPVRHTAPECAFCAARPVTGEYDCDGWHWNASCDSPQCTLGDVRSGRKNISASNRARGFDS